jgi:hypothetical protein
LGEGLGWEMAFSRRTQEKYYYGKRDSKKAAFIASAGAGQPVAEIGKPVLVTVYSRKVNGSHSTNFNTEMANVSKVQVRSTRNVGGRTRSVALHRLPWLLHPPHAK